MEGVKNAVTFDVAFELLDQTFDADMDVTVTTETGGVSPYLGAYDVTPAVRERQILPTQGKRMERDVTVHAIPYAEVSNAAGGKTITIGG